MMRSIFAVHPYSPVTRQHGDSTMRLETMTFSTLLSRTSCMSLQSPSVLAFSSSNCFFSSSVSSSCRPLGLGLLLLELLLLFISLVELQALLGGADELLAIVLLELLHAVLIDGVRHVEDLVALLLELLQEGGSLDDLLGLSRDVVDAGLVLLHASDVLLEGGQLLTRLGGVVAQELGELGAVGGVLVDAELDVLGKALVELFVIILVLSNVVEELDGLLDKVLLDDTEDLVLLQRLARDVEGQILRVDNSLDEGEPLRHEVLAVVHDEDPAHVEADVVLLLAAGLEHVKGWALWHEEHGAELKLPLDAEVLDLEVLLPVVGERLVEGGVLVVADVLWLAHPQWLLLVELVPLVLDLLDLLGLLLLSLVLLIDLLDLWLVVALAIIVLIILILIIGDLLLLGLLHPQLDGESNELGVLLDEVLEAALLEVLEHVLLKVKGDAGSAGEP